MNQSVRTIRTWDLKFFNQWENGDISWDFFDGYYYDSAYGLFDMGYASGSRVRVKSEVWTCSDSRRYDLEGLAYSINFWVIDFANTATGSQIFLCVDEDLDSPTYGQAKFEGYAFSPYIGVQDFTGISFEAITNLETKWKDKDGVLGRYTKVDGIAASSNNKLNSDFDDEVRVLGKIEKSSVRKTMSQKVYRLIQNAKINNGSKTVASTSLNKPTWEHASDGTKLQNDSILYFWDLGGANVTISGESIWNKTLIVEGWNLYISGNIRWDGMLGIIILKKDRNSSSQWNVYIDPSVTDIHASIYADGSILNYDGSSELSWDTLPPQLANQLFIKGSVFTENTLWGGTGPSFTCPYFVAHACDRSTARKYDLNYLRRYRLVESFADNGDSNGGKADYSGAESYMWDNDRENNEGTYRKFPLIIQYDSRIQSSPPPLF